MQKLLPTLLITLALPLFVGLPAVAGGPTLSDLEIRSPLSSRKYKRFKPNSSQKTTEEASSALPFFLHLRQREAKGVTSQLPTISRERPNALPRRYYLRLLRLSHRKAAVKRFQQRHNIVTSGTPATYGLRCRGSQKREQY